MQWTKPQRDRAKAEGKALWSYSYQGKAGTMEANGLMDDQLAACLFQFVLNVYKGKHPGEALVVSGLATYEPPGWPAGPDRGTGTGEG